MPDDVDIKPPDLVEASTVLQLIGETDPAQLAIWEANGWIPKRNPRWARFSHQDPRTKRPVFAPRWSRAEIVEALAKRRGQ